MSLGAYVGLGNSPFNVNTGFNASPYPGQPTIWGVGVGATFGGKDGGLTGSLGINFTTDFNGDNSLGFSAGVGYSFAHHGDADHPDRVTGHNSFSILGTSLSTGANKSSVSVGGFTAITRATASANIQTSSSGFSLAGFGLPISLGYNKTRYYIDQLTNVNTYGCLSNSGWTINSDYSLPDNTAFDTYSLLESSADKDMGTNPDPTVLQGGAYDDFDSYQVVAQGIGGYIRPYKFMGQARGENIKNSDGTYRAKYFSPQRPGPLGGIDQMPEFRFVGDFSNSYRQAYPSYNTSDLSGNAVGSLVLPFDPNPVYGNNDGTYGYDPNYNILAGSRSVAVGTTLNPVNALGYTIPNGNPQGSINGFTVTNESGVKYTFGLPAYSSGEEVYQQAISTANGLSYNRQKKNTPCAFAWYLTTITGPDYVDRNNNQIADDGDWGYWVNFEYGKWSGSYVWRNPSEGYNLDEDDSWKNCSTGSREVYYLNAIRTRSHVALFEKDIRADAKGESANVFAQNSDGSYEYAGLFDNTSTSSMQLSHIYLLNAADENLVTPGSGTLNANVLDRTDVDAVGRANLEAKALRVIDFNYDYSLCPGTTNSFTTPGSLMGKLTLLSLSTRGKGGANITPPNQFQ